LHPLNSLSVLQIFRVENSAVAFYRRGNHQGIVERRAEAFCHLQGTQVGLKPEPLTRSEGVFLGQYIQAATEDLKQNAVPPPAQSFIAILEAFLAVRSLRTDRGGGLDRYYLENLGMPEGGGLNERQPDPGLVPQTVTEINEKLRRNPEGTSP
jgi:hypothetical protein